MTCQMQWCTSIFAFGTNVSTFRNKPLDDHLQRICGICLVQWCQSSFTFGMNVNTYFRTKEPLDYLRMTVTTCQMQWCPSISSCWLRQYIADENDTGERATLCTRAYSVFAQYKGMKATSILEDVLVELATPAWVEQ